MNCFGATVFESKKFRLAWDSTEPSRKKLDMVIRSTRQLYPGTHSVTVRVNGADLGSVSFELSAAAS